MLLCLAAVGVRVAPALRLHMKGSMLRSTHSRLLYPLLACPCYADMGVKAPYSGPAASTPEEQVLLLG